MDADEIQTRIENLGKSNFTNLVRLILLKIFAIPAINMDGSGDGGIDWWLFEKDGTKTRLSIQDTIQVQKWEQKALADARKAVSNFGVNRYFFITNRRHQPISIATLQNSISTELGIPATVLDAKMIAEFVIQGNYIDEFLSSIGQPTPLKKPKIPELALCCYTNISADRSNHRNEIYEDTLLAVCRENQPIHREELVEKALKFLGSAPGQMQLVDRRVDKLLSSKRIIKAKEDHTLSLSPSTSSIMEQTERLYLSEWNALTKAQTKIIQDLGGNWSDKDAELSTNLIARLFMREQLDGLKSARAEILQGLWFDSSGDPKQQLRNLLQESGIEGRKINSAFTKIIASAKGTGVIAKLTRTAVFAALEGQNPLLAARAIGAPSWDEVRILLDASVAIPFLCASRTEPVNSYLYALSSRAVELLQKLGAQTKISIGHLDECASHLLRAFRYEPIAEDADFAAALRNSDNAFVAYYCALRNENRKSPNTLHAFLDIFSERATAALKQASNSWSDAVRKVIPDLQAGLSDYDVTLQNLSRLSHYRQEDLQKNYDVAMHDLKRPKTELLKKHDFSVFSHLQERIEQNQESWIFLTWDRTAIQFASANLSSWVISPEIAMDFAQPCRSLSEAQWSALGHRLARVGDPKEELTARILDQAVRLHYGKLQDWEFKRQIKIFRDDAMGRLPIESDANVHAWVESEVATFFEKLPSENAAEFDGYQ